MTSSAKPSRPCSSGIFDLAWGAWSELGISGWGRTHQGWLIDPEPLIILTAVLGDGDPRLRDGASGWCRTHRPYVSRARLRNLARRVAPHAGRSMEGLETAIDRLTAGRSVRSTVPRLAGERAKPSTVRLDRPSLVSLRLRAICGLGARTEILRIFLDPIRRDLTVADLTELSGYTKRSVGDDCEILHRAGVLDVRTAGNRFHYSMAKRSELISLVGRLPTISPDWTALMSFLVRLLTLEGQEAKAGADTQMVEAHKAVRELGPELHRLALRPPDGLVGQDLVPAFRAWAAKVVDAWASGRWLADEAPGMDAPP